MIIEQGAGKLTAIAAHQVIDSELQYQHQKCIAMRQEENNCQRMLRSLFYKKLNLFKQEEKLEQKKHQLRKNKLKILAKNSTQFDLKVKLQNLKQACAKKQIEYSDIKQGLISNSLKIKETNKQNTHLKIQIAEKEKKYEDLKLNTGYMIINQTRLKEELDKINYSFKQKLLLRTILRKQLRTQRLSQEIDITGVRSQITQMQKIYQALTSQIKNQLV